jgi:hypothetical protein
VAKEKKDFFTDAKYADSAPTAASSLIIKNQKHSGTSLPKGAKSFHAVYPAHVPSTSVL